MDWLLIIITVLSLLSSLISWLVKLRWSKEFKEAKEAQISTLQEKIDFYKEIGSPNLISHLKSTKDIYEGIIKDIQENLDDERLKNREQDQTKEEYVENIEKLLNEKQILIEEVQHRVVNNLAVISGIIQLQILYVDNDNQEFQNLKEIQKRIRVFGIVHMQLAKQGAYSDINVLDLTKQLVENSISIVIETKSQFNLSINKAVPYALLLNEVLNVFQKNGWEQVELRISEDKIGFKISFRNFETKINDSKKFYEKSRLSKELIEALSAQIEVKVKIKDVVYFVL